MVVYESYAAHSLSLQACCVCLDYLFTCHYHQSVLSFHFQYTFLHLLVLSCCLSSSSSGLSIYIHHDFFMEIAMSCLYLSGGCYWILDPNPVLIGLSSSLSLQTHTIYDQCHFTFHSSSLLQTVLKTRRINYTVVVLQI